MMNHSMPSWTPAQSAPIRVGVVDDHPIVRAGLVAELSQHPDITVLAEADTSEGALQIVQIHQPDVLVLDIGLPGIPCEDLVREVMALPHQSHILIFTGHTDVDLVITLLKAGARGYALKDEPPAMLAQAIRTVARGDTWMSPKIASGVLYTINDIDRPAISILSSREIEVLQQLIEGKDNQEIADALCISERTVRFHLRNIYDKLGLRRGAAIGWGIRQGLGKPRTNPLRRPGD